MKMEKLIKKPKDGEERVKISRAFREVEESDK
jgi:hypothetical protein